jgi:hypothetical protein
MKFFISIGVLFLIGLQSFAGTPQCTFDRKDYDSPGFAIPRREGFHIVGQFGCIYRCSCDDGASVTMVTHVLTQSHFDSHVFSEDTGGPARAKWFICPYSVKAGSWQPINDDLGRPIAYNVEANDQPFPASYMSDSPQIQNWMQNSCQKP